MATKNQQTADNVIVAVIKYPIKKIKELAAKSKLWQAVAVAVLGCMGALAGMWLGDDSQTVVELNAARVEIVSPTIVQ